MSEYSTEELSSSDEELTSFSEANSEPEAPSSDSELEDLYESFEYERDGDSPPQSTSTASHNDGVRDRMSLAFDNHKIYPGSLLTVFESSVLVFQYSIRHGLSAKALTELLQLLSLHSPEGASLPKSVYKLKNVFTQAFPESRAVHQWYCSICQRSLASSDSICSGNGCTGGPPATFITLPIGPQMKRIMEGVYTHT